MAKSIAKRYTPKAYSVDAVKRMIVLISEVKDSLSTEVRDDLRKKVVFAHNKNDEQVLRKVVKIMNNHKYQTGIGFQVLSCYNPKHGHNYLEIREDRW